ncbi:GH36-type glycosyl hydrolase domain-containing protein [Simplicispira psychrophila]|uniref:GH36-type glycosyl hydrolase domain-containing protein n=1 Tax=Simplicispira psychrophila TaxID=80882 RepID=UPI00068D3351|nr:glucoamylase family protein [Simplicispira psychrophila]
MEAPIRAEIFGSARFAQHGASLAQAHQARVHGRMAPFFPRLRDNIRVLREAHDAIAQRDAAGHHIGPAGEWLLDNFYVVMAQVKEIHDGLPRSYFRDLPVLLEAHLAGLPRIYGVAWAFVAHTDSAFDEDLLADFLRAYQDTRELTLGELWALPTTLRMVLIENLRRLSERVATARAAHAGANVWCDALKISGQPEPALASLLESMALRGVEQVFALQVLQRLRTDLAAQGAQPAGVSTATLQEMQKTLAEVLPDPATAQIQEHTAQAADALSVRNAITSLRLLGDADWRGLISRCSLLIRQLQDSAIFCAEREDTQDVSLHAIEKLGRRTGLSELSIARAVLKLIESCGQEASACCPVLLDEKRQAPGYWLHGPGLPQLLQVLGASGRLLPWRSRLQRFIAPAYLSVLAVGSIGLTAWFVAQNELPGASWPGLWVLAFLAVWPASEAVIAVLHRLISESVEPQRLPRLALAAGIPPQHRVLVVVPAMLTDPATMSGLVRQLELHFLANPEDQAQFALLTDFADAQAAHREGDTALVAQTLAALDALEARYPRSAPGTPSAAWRPERRFLLLHRERIWSDSEQCWMGWERKRGKLEQLLGVLAEPTSASPFIDLGVHSRPAAGTLYVVTLDSDTVLPPGSLRALVGVAAHPLNLPCLDTLRRRVLSGYTILQPRITTPLPSPQTATPFHWFFGGQSGIDSYSAATSEVYQDVFAEGSFSGKGLLHVAAMHAVLSGRLPQEQILSHDLLEGALARCAVVTDITLMEDAPMHADVASSRIHRWTRGDWQLWPVLLRWRSFHLSGINRWKMLDNLRRSLVAPMSVALIAVCLASATLSPGLALALVVAALGAGPLLGALAGLAPGRDDVALEHFYRQALADVVRALGSTLFGLLVLLQQGLLLMGAITTALWRTLVSRRGLLRWTTAASAQRVAQPGLTGLAMRHAPPTLAAVLLGALWWWAGTRWPVLAVAVCALWAATPVWIWWASRAWQYGGDAVPSTRDREYLLGVARDTWEFFSRHVGPQSRHLPPDNVQMTPHEIVAERTSPTNMGLYLLSVACARRFGWITTEEFLQRCEHTVATMALLARHRGHFLNWYDTQTLQTLAPAYVSTVDSGNLCGHLVAVVGACQELINGPAGLCQGESLQRVQRLADQLQHWAMEPEFDFLYDARRRLFHIGYRVDGAELDKSFYDLLASEARLASLWGIAKGDVPVTHWAALGRPFYAMDSRVGLRSWSGSMFEYLMPALVVAEPVGSALERAARTAVDEQQAFARQHRVPWGISESAYAASDQTLAYQYAPQGVPRLALRRTPPDELVVAPYASVLAAMFDTGRAAENLRWLERLQARGEMGFIEALDFTPERQVEGSTFIRVDTFMSHHQGMSIVALANVLLGGAPRRWAMGQGRLEAIEFLLQERVPREVSRLVAPEPLRRRRPEQPDAAAARDALPGAQGLQPTLLMSNNRYSVSLRANGAGWSRFEGADLSRWRDDALRDAYGTFFYLRRHSAGVASTPVSLTQHPAPDAHAHYSATFHSDHLSLHAQWPDLRSCCTVWVSPEDDIELRKVELWNLSDQPITLDVLSLWEVSLLDARADESHPAFANLFVHAEWDSANQALYFVRKPHLERQEPLHAVHFIAHTNYVLTKVQAQTDRALWLGRNHDAAHPLAYYDDAGLEKAERATGLDPVASLSVGITIPALASVQITLASAVARSRDALETLVDRYRQPAVIERSTIMSATFASVRMRELGLTLAERNAIQTLTTLLTLLHARPFAYSAVDQFHAVFDRRVLWRFGLSGERPLIIISVGAVHDLRPVRSLLQALRLWSWGGVLCDLVILNTEPWSYSMPVQLELRALSERYASDMSSAPARACGLHVLYVTDITPPEQVALNMMARIYLHADGRALSAHVGELVQWHDDSLGARTEQAVSIFPPLRPAASGSAAVGQFDVASGAYSFQVSPTCRPPRPWINVLANAGFGAHISEAGAGYSWAGNSRLNQLTVWTNDPVADTGGECFWLQDLRTREIWNIGPGAGCADAAYTVEHRQGSTTLRHRRGDLEVSATWCVDAAQALKQVRIAVQNQGGRAVNLRAIGLLEWVMGAQRLDRQSVRAAFVAVPAPGGDALAGDVLLATQSDDQGAMGGNTAFLMVWREGAPDAHLRDWTCDRRELFDPSGQRVIPDHLGAQAIAGLDPCAAASVKLLVPGGGQAACVFVLGHGATRAEALALASMCLAESAQERESAVLAHWNELLEAVTVQTPDPLFDALTNRWLLYQTVACRLWARAGFYQAGGAFGFRDQLQDTMALALAAPHLLRQQLLLAASRQFQEGDVQHWWHEPTGAGVRTHCSDDLLWLPYATARYIDITGDTAVLDEAVPFLEGAPIPPDTQDAYYVPQISIQSATLYEHCARTLERSLTVGVHGLPLIGSGDWNDGMSRVGEQGRGESVWLCMFLCQVVQDFMPLALGRDDLERTVRWDVAVQGWRNALLTEGWDGAWFKRAFFDDGTPLGTHSAAECRIDLIAQAWSVLANVASPEHQRTAMESAAHLLVDEVHGLNRLLDPPLQDAAPNAGYIQAYPPGVRENGGQYSHGGVWKLMAQARLGDGDGAYRTFTQLSAAHRSADPLQGPVYGLEPYVMAADVYTHAPYVGRGGWSWYTGSAAWMYRAAVESICGLHVRDNQVCFSPHLPSHWPSINVTLRRAGRVHEFMVCAADAPEALAQAQARGAIQWHTNEWLSLDTVGNHSCYLIVVPTREKAALVT